MIDRCLLRAAILLFLCLLVGPALAQSGPPNATTIPVPPSIQEPPLQEPPRGLLRRRNVTPRRQQLRTRLSEGISDPLAAAVDPYRYRIGSGDVITVKVMTDTEDDHILEVSPQGTISLYPAGPIPVAGLRASELTGRLRQVLSRYYHDFRLTATLSRLRRFPVNVTGQVVNPGTYQGSGGTGVVQAIADAGGLTDTASYRRVRLVDSNTGRVLRELDLLRWLELGDPAQNPTLSAHQTVVVPPAAEQIEVAGALAQPGEYEVLPGERINELLPLLGGFLPNADRRDVMVGRLLPSGKRELHRLNLAEATSPDWGFQMLPGDTIQVLDRSLAQGQLVVMGEVEGRNFFPVTKNQSTGLDEVQRRATYRLSEGEKLSEVVNALGGPTAKADQEHAWVERNGPQGELLRIKVNLRKLLIDGDAAQDLVLQDGDVLKVPAVADNVFLMGHFVRPGPHPYTPGYGMREYIAAVGGTTAQAHTKHGKLIRAVHGEAPLVWDVDLLEVMEGSEPAVEIREGDIIYAPLYAPVFNEILAVINSVFLFSTFFNR